MAKDPAFLFYPGDWLGGTLTFNRAHKGAYMDLLMAQYSTGHMSIDDIKTVLGPDFDLMWESKLKRKFKIDDNGLFYNHKLEDVINSRRGFTQSRVNNLKGKKSKNTYMDSHISNHMDNHMENGNENENINKEDNRVVGEEETKQVIQVKDWRNDFETYRQDCLKVYQELIIDTKFISDQQKFHPGVDISLSLEKAVTNFWATEAGWRYKKKKRSKDLNWRTTLINAIDINKVYKQQYGNNKQKSTGVSVEFDGNKGGTFL